MAPQIIYILRDLEYPPSCVITLAFTRAQKYTEINIHQIAGPPQIQNKLVKHSNSLRNVGEPQTHHMLRYDV